MSMLRSSVAIAVVLVLGTVTSARADEVAPPAPAPAAPSTPPEPAPAAPAAASPLNYVAASVTTTLIYQPNQGSLAGWQHDIGPVVGFGRYITDTVALELDLGPTYVKGDYVSFALVPAAVWNFSTHVYAAARFLVPLDPELNFALFPGVGGVYTFKNQLSLTLEVNLASTIGRGDPDLGVTLTPGMAYSF